MSTVAAIDGETVGRVLRAAAERLRQARIDTAMLDARVLLARHLGIVPVEVPLHGRDPIDDAVMLKFERDLSRRLSGEPVARILGTAEFWSLDFKLSPDTLVPRPDTETLVEAVLDFADATAARDRELRLLDLGTGSGCVAVALASELPKALVVAVDASEGAARIAAANARRHGVGDRVRVVVGDWLAALDGPFDIVVSNPPYIPTAEIARLDVSVRAHDPRRALDGGEDGLDAYRSILADLGQALASDGRAYFELAADDAARVCHLAHAVGLICVTTRQDLAGRERVLVLGRDAVGGLQPKKAWNRGSNRLV